MFESAKFGDRFRTSDGRLAIYGAPYVDVDGYHWLFFEIENGVAYDYFDNNGVVNSVSVTEFSIVGRW